jgi:phosphoglycerol transferase MdoB-like AlkP superfamily enzyme
MDKKKSQNKSDLALWRSWYLYPAWLLLFWLVFFAFFRLVFLFRFVYLWPGPTNGSTFTSLFYGLPLDASLTAYFLAIPVLIWVGHLLINRPFSAGMERGLLGYSYILLNVCTVLLVCNLILYAEWQIPLNIRAFSYLSSPQVIWESLGWIPIILYFLVYLVLSYYLFGLFKKTMNSRTVKARVPIMLRVLVIPVVFGGLLFIMRGGAGRLPINESRAYYSRHLFENHAATNVVWELVKNVQEKSPDTNPFIYTSEREAREALAPLFVGSDTIHEKRFSLLESNQQPINVVLVIMESMGAQVIGAMGGLEGVCPNLDTLIAGGFLFDSCYSSGYRTDQGLTSLLSGYPALPDESIIFRNLKAQKLPSLPKSFKTLGYQSAFFYGGATDFANMGSWLHQQEFDLFASIKDFPVVQRTQNWGVDDRHLLLRSVNDMSTLEQPFFSTVMTLSLHQPFDTPGPRPYKQEGAAGKYLNSAYFADSALGEFMAAAAKTDWYKNTLFIFSADHGHPLPSDWYQDIAKVRHMPLFFYGPALNKSLRGKRFSSICNHHDLAGTLLAAFGLPHSEYPWSRDVSTAQVPFAYYSFEGGLGWISPEGTVFTFFNSGDVHVQSGADSPERKKRSEAYLQILYDDFLSK